MTEAEFLQNTFVCTRLPGGYARLSYATCVARQEKKEAGGRWGDESKVIFYACLDCDQGRKNKQIWEERTRNMGSGRGTCGCCGRPDMSYANRFAGVYVCGFCIRHLKDAEKHGVTFEQAKEEIKAAAGKISPGEKAKFSWNRSEMKSAQQSKSITANVCRKSECVYFDHEFDGNCTKYGDDASESCETYSSIKSDGSMNQDVTKPIKNEAPSAPLHDMGYPEPSERDKEFIAARLKAQQELLSSVPYSSHNRSVPPNPDETRYLIIDLQSEAEIAEWLRRKAKVNRRSYLVDQVLAILDSNMAADREMDGRAA